ncbi:MAG: FHA domain-containing protein [Firmicutes bacterium]|nr:FHA domain-containing protein [Bacillota bacterium]
MRFQSSMKDGLVFVLAEFSDQEPINQLELNDFAAKKFSGFLRPVQEKSGIIYVGQDAVPLASYLKTPIEQEEFFLMVEQVVMAAQRLVNYHFPVLHVYWHLDQVYINERSKELQFIYLPTRQQADGKTILLFLAELTGHVRTPEGVDPSYLENFYQFLRTEPDFNPINIESYVSRIDPEIVELFRGKSESPRAAVPKRPAPKQAAPEPVLMPETPAQPQNQGFYQEEEGQQVEETIQPQPYAQAQGMYQPDAAPAYQPEPEPAPAYQPEPAPAFGFVTEPQPQTVSFRQEAPQETPAKPIPAYAPEPAAQPIPAYAPEPAAQPIPAYTPEPAAPVQPMPAAPIQPEPAPFFAESETTEPVIAPQPAPVPTQAADSAPRFATLRRKNTGELITLDKPVFRIGKDSKHVDYALKNAAISRTHAEIITRDGNYYLYDLKSSNGTYIEEERIPAQKEIQIYGGTTIQLANEAFLFQEP